MKPDSNNLPPVNFCYCMNKECKRATQCLRYVLMLDISAEIETLSILNPAHVRSDGGDCTRFFPDKKHRFALGITYLLDDVPHSKAVTIKNLLMSNFHRATYYRWWRRERLISPTEQQVIRDLFLTQGVKEEPVYDEYIERYDW